MRHGGGAWSPISVTLPNSKVRAGLRKQVSCQCFRSSPGRSRVKPSAIAEAASREARRGYTGRLEVSCRRMDCDVPNSRPASPLLPAHAAFHQPVDRQSAPSHLAAGPKDEVKRNVGANPCPRDGPANLQTPSSPPPASRPPWAPRRPKPVAKRLPASQTEYSWSSSSWDSSCWVHFRRSNGSSTSQPFLSA